VRTSLFCRKEKLLKTRGVLHGGWERENSYLFMEKLKQSVVGYNFLQSNLVVYTDGEHIWGVV
jgi:hypothetical protein